MNGTSYSSSLMSGDKLSGLCGQLCPFMLLHTEWYNVQINSSVLGKFKKFKYRQRDLSPSYCFRMWKVDESRIGAEHFLCEM
jgi:hypothetical protein